MVNLIIRPKNPYIGKAHQSKQRWQIKWGVLIFWIIVILGAVYFFAYSSFFKISDIIVEGTDIIDKNEVLEIVEKHKSENENLFRYPIDDVEKEIKEKYLQINNVNVTRGVPKTIKIQISERKGFLVWQINDKNYLVDEKGIIFRETEDTFSLPIIIDKQVKEINLGDKILTKQFVRFIDKINKNFTKKTKVKIKRIEVPESTFELHVITSKGWKVMFDTTRDADIQINAMKKIYPHIKSDIKKYLDLRTENWAYYK